MSNYIVSINPQFYGGKQEDYILRTDEIIKQTVIKIQSAISEKKDLVQLFYDTLNFFEEERRKIAKLHGTEDADKFGVRRDLEEFEGPMVLTALYTPYHEYNPRAIHVLQKHLKTMNYTKIEFLQSKLKVDEENFLNREFSKEFLILNKETAPEWQGFLIRKI